MTQRDYERAFAIVNGRPSIGGMKILDPAAEEILGIILKLYDGNKNRYVENNDDVFPEAYQFSIKFEFEKLALYGMITSPIVDIYDNWQATLAPQGITYFEDKEKAMEKENTTKQLSVNIGSIVANDSNVVFGDVINSSLSVDNSIHRIEQEIEEKGGDDSEELRELLNDIKELIENIQESRYVPKCKGLFTKLSQHLEKHGWFYGEVIGLLGAKVLQMTQG